MKRQIIFSAALVFATAQVASAGGMGEPLMSPDQVTQETAASSHDVIVPLMLLLIIAAMASSGSSVGGGGGGLIVSPGA